MALQEIIETLEQENQVELAKIDQETILAIKELEKDFNQKIEAEKEAILESARQTSGRCLDMDLFAQKSKYKQELLRKKREILLAVYNQALVRLSKLLSADYQNLLIKLLKTLPQSSGQILGNKKDRHLLEEAVKKADLKMSVAVADQELLGGFIWQGENINIDITFAAIIEEIKSQTETVISQELFGGTK